jgi:hypothetical protein
MLARMAAYDVIGDVHGNLPRLEGLLRRLGYARRRGAWRHDERTAVFVGDIIDRHRGTQRATVRLVRDMVEAGSARMVVGNHEFNAVAYATPHPTGDGYCRPHSDKNTGQHEAFLDEIGFGTGEHRSILDWFRQLPLWLDLGALRVAHACWSSTDIELLDTVLDVDGSLTDRAVVDGTTRGTDTHRAIENVLKGPEVPIHGYSYPDRGGTWRTRARIAWWDPAATNLRDAAVIPDPADLRRPDGTPADSLPDEPLDADVPRYTDPTPVVFGHYWKRGEVTLESSTTVCVDYSAGHDGPLVAYRWSGEDELADDHLVAF